MSKALEDVVVLDTCTEFWASLGAALLGDFGAQVIKVEGLTGPRGSGLREQEPQAAWDYQFELANRNKQSLAVDLDAEQGREVLHQLVQKADVFITDQPSSLVQDRGLDYDSLARLKEDIIYARGSGLGPKGPDRDLPALDEIAAARSGMMPTFPQPGQPPVYTGAGQMYTSVMLAFGVLTALVHRQETGEGQEVDVSLLGGYMYGASLDLQAFLAIGGERFLQPLPRLDAGNPMSGVLYPTKDGLWITLTMPETDRWWPALAEIVGLDVQDPRFNSHEKRCEVNRLELIRVLEEAFRQQPAAHWRTIFTERQMSADVIEEYSYPANDEQAFRNRYILELDHPSLGAIKTLGFPIYMSDSPARLSATAPCLGQHTAEVLSEKLGYSEEQITELEVAGVVR